MVENLNMGGTDETVSEGSSEEMTHLDLVNAMKLGSWLEFVKRASMHNYPLKSPEMDGEFILPALGLIEATLRESDLNAGIADEVSRQEQKLRERYSPETGGSQGTDGDVDADDDEFLANESVTISSSDGDELASAVQTWEQILRNKLGDEVRLRISSRGIVNVEKVMNDPSELFHSDSMWESLPDQTQGDLSEACRAVAVNCPTASVFLSLRAVEERLGEWYSEETNNELDKQTFGQVLHELDNQFDDDSRPSLLSHLDYLRERRNQVAHPVESPGSQEAESTLVMVRETISNIQDILDEG